MGWVSWVKILQWLEESKKLKRRDFPGVNYMCGRCSVSSIYLTYLNWSKHSSLNGGELNKFYLIFLHLTSFLNVCCMKFSWIPYSNSPTFSCLSIITQYTLPQSCTLPSSMDHPGCLVPWSSNTVSNRRYHNKPHQIFGPS